MPFTLSLSRFVIWQYLVESIRQFPTQERFLGMLQAAGFGVTTYTNLSLGVVAIHSGFKLLQPSKEPKRV